MKKKKKREKIYKFIERQFDFNDFLLAQSDESGILNSDIINLDTYERFLLHQKHMLSATEIYGTDRKISALTNMIEMINDGLIQHANKEGMIPLDVQGFVFSAGEYLVFTTNR